VLHGRAAVTEDEVLAFVRTYVGSVYGLELLLLVSRDRRVWDAEELVRELRSSSLAVGEALDRLKAAGLVSENTNGRYCFAPRTETHEQLAGEIEKLYAAKPMSLIKAIVAAPDEKLRIFSDAFKLKE
jgi:hypothetical protein